MFWYLIECYFGNAANICICVIKGIQGFARNLHGNKRSLGLAFGYSLNLTNSMLEQKLTYFLHVSDIFFWEIPRKEIRGYKSWLTGCSVVTAGGVLDAVYVSHNIGLGVVGLEEGGTLKFLVPEELHCWKDFPSVPTRVALLWMPDLHSFCMWPNFLQ